MAHFPPWDCDRQSYKASCYSINVNLHHVQRLPGSSIMHSGRCRTDWIVTTREEWDSLSLSRSVHSRTGQSRETRGKDANTCQDHVWGTASSPCVSKYSAWLSSPGRIHQCCCVAVAELWPLCGWGTSEKRISCMHICFLLCLLDLRT